MAINKHGIKIEGLKKASGETENYGAYGSLYNEIVYDRTSGEVWAKAMTKGSYTVGDDLLTVSSHNHMTMQEIADAIFDKLNKQEA